MSTASVADFLGHVRILSGVPPAVRGEIAAEALPRTLGQGEWLFHAGDPGTSAYVVQTGRLEIVAAGDVVIGEVKRGGVIGELAPLREEARAASVRARRASDLFELRGDTFTRLVREVPEFAVALMRELAGQLAANRPAAPRAEAPTVLAVIGVDAGAPVAEVTERLTTGLRRYGTVAQLGEPEWDRPPDDLPAMLQAAERGSDHVLLSGRGQGPSDPWTAFCLREADLAIVVASGPPGEEWLARAADLRGCELLVTGSLLPRVVLDRLSPREVHVRPGLPEMLETVDALARRLAGRSLGLVLSGGGARAFAHLGVVEELMAAGLRFDRFAGVSLGSVVAGSLAMGFEIDAIYERFVRHFVDENPSNDYTIPAIALLRGRKVQRVLADVMGDIHIEQLPASFFCLSCDLVGRTPVVHRTGLLRDALYASLAIPGVFPPVLPGDGRLLVDGGVLDNLPVKAMSGALEGPVVASDVTTRDGRWAQARRPGLEKLARPLRRGLTGSGEGLPRLGETLFRTFTLGSTDTAAAARAYADLVVVPQVEGVGLMDWKQLDRLREAGRVAARAALDASASTMPRWAPA